MQQNAKDVDEYLSEQPDWQVKNIEAFRTLIHEVYPEVVEEIKWGVPVFVCKSKTLFGAGTFKGYTKYTFMHNGAQLADPHKLFNNGLESKKSRSIDVPEGRSVDPEHLKALILEAVSKA